MTSNAVLNSFDNELQLWLTRPPRSTVLTIASVPDKNYTGYSINQYGSLVKNPLLRKKPTFFYNVAREVKICSPKNSRVK